ncbi:hypothetical protein TNCV_25381 [Trichonephila clavipes]|uniref:Uncharacterized protein n=1 Tax=Trichonephila clavipes TaxID=2585209 RepID=A0A8X7BBW2_TRICX|nr:hypothetical protein TNCV_25381 [Trichonephila clavipes]
MYIQDRFGSYRSIEWTKTDWNCTRYSIITCFAQTSDSLARLTQTLARMPDVMDMRERNINDTLASDRVTGVNSSDSSSSLSVLLWSKATISASDRALPKQQCPCQPTRSRQTSNLVLEELPKGMVQH